MKKKKIVKSIHFGGCNPSGELVKCMECLGYSLILELCSYMKIN